MRHATLITTWLKQRQTLLVALYELCHYRPFVLKMRAESFQEALQEFSGHVLDYLSLGHFKVYETLSQDRGPLTATLQQLNESTHQILNLKDRHRFHFNSVQLERDLGFLASRLAKRFEIEDKLLSACLANRPLRFQH